MNRKTVGQRIAYERKKKGWSQEILVEKLGWEKGQTRLSKYENDKRRIKVNDIQDIADALGVSIDRLIASDDALAADMPAAEGDLSVVTLQRIITALIKASDEKRKLVMHILEL